MKNFQKVIIAALVLAIVFFIGRCSKKDAAIKTVETVTVDTVWKDRVITVDPIPTPTQVRTVTAYRPDPKQSELILKLEKEVAYFNSVVDEKNRLLAALQSGESDLGIEVGVDAPTTKNQAPPSEQVLLESQLINIYDFEETDSLTGVRLVGKIGVLGYLSENPPPSFGLIYPEFFTTKTSATVARENVKNRGIGLALALRNDLTGKSTTQTGARLQYRRGALLTGAGVWSNYNNYRKPVAIEGFIGLEVGWSKK